MSKKTTLKQFMSAGCLLFYYTYLLKAELSTEFPLVT